jgi:Tol biopolymer transport system component/DNA-binding winged helix-turn-helix (wHTH) protein
MPAGSQVAPIYRFGTFELDTRSAELRKNGVKLRIQEQPYQVLLKLLQHPGEIVSRDELRASIWPADTFVDFETGLNTIIKRLRETLCDSADTPAFIETLPRRGYRFVAPVEMQPRSSQTTGPAEKVGSHARVAYGLWSAIVLTVFVLALCVIVWSKLDNSPPRIVAAKQITNDGLPKTSGPVSDGSRIYFGEFSSGRNILKQVSSRGGETEVIQTSLPDPLIEDFSREDSQLLVQAGKDQWNPEGSDFWLVPVPRGPTHRMEGVVGRAGGWVPGPNGKFYFSKNKDLYIADHDGSNAHKIATAAQQVTAIQGSPDGSRLRFTVSDLGKCAYSLWEVRLDGSGLRPLLPGRTPLECCGTWTPDGQYYLFQSLQRNIDINNIWVMRERTGFLGNRYGPTRLAAAPTSFSNMAFGNNDTPIFAVGEQRRAELVAFDKYSGNFLPFLSGISAGDLDFSRDGKWVAYVTYPDGLLWRSRLDGSDALQLTFSPTRAALIHWSPDGREIAFSQISPGKPWKISLIGRDGGALQELTRDDLVETDPNWSPDGNTLAYGVYLPGRPDQAAIRLFDLKTHSSRQLPGSEGVCFPRWSPNGRYLVANSLPDDTKLELFDFKIKKWRELVSNVGTIAYYSWSLDNNYVYFDNLLTDDPSYLRIRVVDSKLERITSLKSLRRYISDFGVPYSGLAPGDIPIFARDTGMQEIYALDWQH